MKKSSKKSKKRYTIQLLILLILGTVLITLLINQYISSLLENKLETATIEYNEPPEDPAAGDSALEGAGVESELFPRTDIAAAQEEPGTQDAQDAQDEQDLQDAQDPSTEAASAVQDEDADAADAATDSAAAADKPEMEITLYFIQITGDYTFAPIKFTRKIPRTLSVLRSTLELLLEGQDQSEKEGNVQTFIPQNTELRNIYIQDSTVFVDFNEAFRFNEYGGVGLLAQLYQIVYTCTEFSTLDSVQILINGEKIPYLGDAGLLETDRPLNRERLNSYYSTSSP